MEAPIVNPCASDCSVDSSATSARMRLIYVDADLLGRYKMNNRLGRTVRPIARITVFELMTVLDK